jgi:hypothetical protein
VIAKDMSGWLAFAFRLAASIVDSNS